jgi:hypothetical protein
VWKDERVQTVTYTAFIRNAFDLYSEGTLTLREEHRLRVFENRVLRRIFGLKRDEVTGEWRKLHNEKLHGPPLWSSGQSYWLQIRRPGFDSRHYQKKK